MGLTSGLMPPFPEGQVSAGMGVAHVREGAWDTDNQRREMQAQQVAALGAPAPDINFNHGTGATPAYNIQDWQFTDPNRQASSLITSPHGRRVDTLFDWVDPAFEEPLHASEAGGWTMLRNLLSGQQIQEMRPRLGVFRNQALWRMIPRYTPPAAASQVGQASNMIPMAGAKPPRAPAVMGNKVLRWPLAAQTYRTITGKDPQA